MSEPLRRPDLDAVTIDTLIALANRGLVKRAQREVDSVQPPTIRQSTDSTLSAQFADGTRAELTDGVPLSDATCSCGAKSLCRHRIALVLGYQRHAGPATGDDDGARWSPGDITDDELSEHFGSGAIRAATRRVAVGFAAIVHRSTPPIVELSTNTVTFRVARKIDYATCDSAGQDGAIAVICAVWAFRAADERDPDAAEITVDVGDAPDAGATTLADAIGREVLNIGTVNTSQILLDRVVDVASRLEQLNARWLADVAIDLHEQLDAYRERSAVFDIGRVAELLAEIRARTSAVGGPRLTPSQVIGADVARSAPMKLTTLTALGAIVRRRGPLVSLVVYVAGDGTIMTIHRGWPDKPDLSYGGAAVAAARIGGTTTARLAAGSIVTAASERLANRRLKLSTSVAARTSVTPVGRAWENLPGNIRVDDFSTLEQQLQQALPKLLRPRHEAANLKVLVVMRVVSVCYEPGGQRLTAEITDALGHPALVVDDYRVETPGALDALAAALRSIAGARRPAMISGVIRRAFGRLVVAPIALLTDAGLTIPSFAAAPSGVLPTDHPAHSRSAAGRVTQDVLDYLAHCAHRGLAQLPRDFAGRVGEHAERLQNLGFDTTASVVSACGDAAAQQDLIADAWSAAMIRLVTLSERL